MSNESASLWRNAFYALFGLLQVLCVGILLHIVNRLDELAKADSIANERISLVVERVARMEGRLDKTLAQIYNGP